MSLANSPDCLFRAEDKALKLLYPTIDQTSSNTFDEFFHKELYASSEDEDPVKREDSTDRIDLFPDSLTNDYGSIHAAERHYESSPTQPWRKGVWCLTGQSNSRLVVGKTRKTNMTPPSNISPAHLVVNDNFAFRSPRPAAHTYDTKSLSPSRLQQAHCSNLDDRQRNYRGLNNTSPSPMYPRSSVRDRNGYVDAWQQDFQDFNLQLDDDQSDTIAFPFDRFQEHSNQFYKQSKCVTPTGRPMKMEQRSVTMHHLRGADQRHKLHQATHELSTILNANLNATGHNMLPSAHSNEMNFRFVNEDVPSMTNWTTESLHSSNSSHNSHFSHNSQESYQVPVYNGGDPNTWWLHSPGRGQAHFAQGSRDNFPVLAQPQPRRVTHHTIEHDTYIDDTLDTRFPDFGGIGIALPYHPPELQPSSMTSQTTGHTNALAAYPPLPPPVEHDFLDESPFTTPRRISRAPTRTPSPVSPMHRPSRTLRQRSPSRRDTSQHGRKSIHKSGPIKGSETPRRRSTSRPPRTPKTPKTPQDGFGQIDFVNFTPKDANKLLTDVAPSGSSKTRARREQEAREKRKKLSEAALNAVRRAGGDVEAVEKAILS